jgi:hypothetical protein
MAFFQVGHLYASWSQHSHSLSSRFPSGRTSAGGCCCIRSPGESSGWLDRDFSSSFFECKLDSFGAASFEVCWTGEEVSCWRFSSIFWSGNKLLECGEK